MRYHQTESPTEPVGPSADAEADTATPSPCARRGHPAARSGRRAGARTMAVAVVVTLAIGLGACGSDGDNASGDGPSGGNGGGSGEVAGASDGANDGDGAASDAPEACSLLEAAEVEAEFEAPNEGSDGSGRICSWQIDGDGFDGALTLELMDLRGMTAEEQFTNWADNVTSITTIDGIGDEAFSAGASNGDIVVRKGGVVFSLMGFYMGNVPSGGDKVKALAQLVDERL